MKKVLVHSGMGPFDNPSTVQILKEQYSIGTNLGNLLFANSVFRSVMTEDTEVVSTYYKYVYTDEEIEQINAEFDCFLIPLADAFRPDFIHFLNNLTVLVKRLTIPCIVIGVGLRADYEQKELSYPFDKDVKDFVEAILEKSTMLGLRGDFTGKYLEKLGFKPDRDFTVIGCPSLYLQDGVIKIDLSRIQNGGGYVFNTTSKSNSCINTFIQNCIPYANEVSVIEQTDWNIRKLYLGRFASRSKNVDCDDKDIYGLYYEKIKSQGKIIYFNNIHSWIKYLGEKSLSINTRFHGSVAGFHSGTPTIVIPVDSRMKELIEYHKLPSISPLQLTEHLQLDYWLDHLDFTLCTKVARSNFLHYIDFLDANSINHIFSPKHQGANSKYDLITSSINWGREQKAFEKVSIFEKVNGLSGMYKDRILRR